MNVKKVIELLGLRGIDKITGSKGVITSVSFDLFGCTQVILAPQVTQEGKLEDGQWYDVDRIRVVSKTRVMGLPQFDLTVPKGPAEKPIK